MSSGFEPIARLELSDTTISVGYWFTSSASGVKLDQVHLTWADVVLLIATLQAEMPEYERSLIAEKLASVQAWREAVECPGLSSEATENQICEHYRDNGVPVGLCAAHVVERRRTKA